MAWVTDPDRQAGVGMTLVSAFLDRGWVYLALVFVFSDRGRFVVGSSRGTAHHLPEGRFAVPDPDDEDRMTYWRVESITASGSKKELRPWPADVRWAPLRPPYPEGLDRQQRKDWSQDWYDDVYFAWKDEVVAAIAADPQAAADEFARSAPTAELPAPVRKRPRVRLRPLAVSKKQREIAAQSILAEAFRRAGMSEREIAGEIGLPKTTTHRRLSGASLADGVAGVIVDARIAGLIADVLAAARTAGPEDIPRLLVQLERVKRLQAKAAGLVVPELGLFDGGAEW